MSLPFRNGCMQEAMKEPNIYQTSKLMPVPFIYLDAGNTTTLNSALMYAASERKLEYISCIVTFDSPLLLKIVKLWRQQKRKASSLRLLSDLEAFTCV